MLRHNYSSLIHYIILRRIILYFIVINWLKEQITDALGNIMTLEYDCKGNLIKTKDPLGNLAQMTYDAIGRLIMATDAKGNNTNYVYDLLNRVKEITDALDKKTSFAYDANGNLLSVTDAKNQTITYTYNNRDKVATMTDQLGKVETYTYDKNDNLTSLKDRKEQVASYTYDMLNRVTRVDYADGSYTTYQYDAIGRLVYINDSISGPISYVYSNTGCSLGCGGGAADKIIQEITSLGSISYEYDAIGRRTKMTVAGQPDVNYSYDVNSRLTNINTLISGVLKNFNIQYDSLGRKTALNLPNGVITNYSYDNASHLLEMKHLNPLNQILEQINYVYDANGNRTKMDRQNAPVKLPDPKSNITYNSANQILTFNDKTVTYDANGNMETITNSCGTTTYSWDARNRLTAINGFNTDCSPLTASFKYDALGRRIQKTITRTGTVTDTMYLYDGMDIVQEIENGTVTVNYLRTLNIDEPLARIKTDGTIRYYQQDALGSVIALTDEIGVIKTQYSYDPFGNTTIIGEASDNPFQFAGRENDVTGLLFERNRYLSLELQRYISQDPIGFAGGDVNFYVRVGNNPVNKIDPTGLIAVPVAIAACMANPACASALLAGGAAAAAALSKLIENIEVPSGPEEWPDLSNIPERCRIEYEICKKAADQAECGEVKRTAKKAWCWTKFLVCLGGTGL